MKPYLFFFLLTASSLINASCFAEVTTSKTLAADTKIEPAAIDIYLQKLDGKFDRGAANFVTGWTEILRQPAQAFRKDSPQNVPLKFLGGLGQGLWNGVADTLGGFTNALTSPFPQWEIPLPQGGVKPEQITGGAPSGYGAEQAANPSPSAA